MTSEISISSSDSSVPGVGGLPTHGNSESSILPIIGHKLNGLNYLQWSQSVFMFISGKGKEDYLTGTIETPSKDDPNYKKWNSENHMVMSWLIKTIKILKLARISCFMELPRKFGRMSRRHIQTMRTLQNTSKSKLDIFEKITWDCQLDKKKYDKIVEKERIFKLLLGLNKDLDEVRGRILGTKPLPSLREAFSEVRREESRKKIMMGRPGIQNSGESSALAAYGTNYKGSDNQPHKGKPWCDHCCRPGHIKEKCWKIHGKPANWKPRKPQPENRGYVATTEEKSISEDVVFSKEQLELLQNMFNQAQINPPVIGSGTIAQKGIFPSAFNSKVEKSNPWVIDTGASDHMTGDISLFSSYSTCSNNYKVRIADGSLSTVSGMGSIVISPSITLDYVLLVPSLSCNLLSISKLTKNLKCVANFFPTHCIFQVQDSRKMIGNAKECAGLYLLKDDNLVNETRTDQCISNSVLDPNPSTVPAESGDDYEEMNRLKTILTKEFEIKDLGKLKHFLSMEVARSNKGISISQRKYTLDLLKETGMLGCKPVDTPMDPICKLGRKEGNWAGSITDRRSTSGYCTYVWGNLVTWRSKKQYVVSRSSAEAEFRAIALSICDNLASINIVKNPVHHDRTKHVEIDRHFIREKIEGGIIQMVYTPSSHQTADILTKALPKGNFDNLNSKVGMINIYSQLEGE
ncbi:hypothetical protein RJ639_007262 [Escallonia herrerae]|uniref:Retrovirus-related Pol polyprotein from transposon RE1 n=1 Tax=Escallonia herrerae TaxID=1293975 RepID=A0AA89AT76_9ASTE|nr:hypothetical protein RJ639_007262 [Escallonia herrerae]